MSDWLQRVRDLEPARVRAVWTAVVALLLAVGVTVNADVDGAVQALIVAVFTILPLIQGETTRRKVTPVFTVEHPDPRTEEAAAPEGVPVNEAGANGVTSFDPPQDVDQESAG